MGALSFGILMRGVLALRSLLTPVMYLIFFPHHKNCRDTESTPYLQICMAFANALTLQNTSKGKEWFELLFQDAQGYSPSSSNSKGWVLLELQKPGCRFRANIGSYLVLHGPRHDSGSHGCSL
eukprot:7775024-Pyramimonas_sp.AAC.1